jgi:beta-mannosidase
MLPRFIPITALLLLAITPLHAQQQIPLDTNWTFRAVSAPGHPAATTWHPATVPGVVQTDLLHAGLIADPFVADNEQRLQWIGLTDWEYATTFTLPPETLRRTHLELVFDGLDTYADVTLNGTRVLSLGAADSQANQFRSWRVDAKPYLHLGPNTLHILFHSPTNLLTPIVAKLPVLIPGTGYEPLDPAHNLYPVSHYMRKAPYSYGWDWGPKFVTLGIWKPIHLEAWDGVRVTGFHLQQTSVTADRATAVAALDLTSDVTGPVTLQVRITTPDGHALPTVTTPIALDRGENHLIVPLRIDHPQRWFPNGYGPQSRYTLHAELLRGQQPLAHAEVKTGLRSVELQRTPDQWGTSFTFVVNGIPIFAKGANFVPMDSFAPSITAARRRALLTAARDAHMNMLRVWGGGYYPEDDFYDLCDQLGLMVWQDFMFGGALVPGDLAFQENVRAEAVEQVTRLSDHPSLVLWCGNNEVEDAWREWPDHLAFEKTLAPEQRERIWQDYVVLFRDILKSVVAAHGNGVPYWPSTPSANFDDVPTGKEDGDMHSWKVWSAGAPITDYAAAHTRFLSEFGFQSMPALETVRAYAADNEDLESPALQNHERFHNGYDRMNQYLAATFRPARDFASFLYLSQLEQAEAIKFGVETMRARRPETMGTLFWQLDDCWPVASWSSVDYYGRFKALQYYAARFYAPVLIVAEPSANALRIHLVSDDQLPHHATLHLRLLRFDGTLLDDQSRPVDVAPLASTAIPALNLPTFDPAATVAVLRLESDDTILATTNAYFALPKDLALPSPTIARTLHPDATGFNLTLTSPVLARAVQLDLGPLDANPSDNFFDLLPNQPRTLHIVTRSTAAQLQSAMEIRSLATATR